MCVFWVFVHFFVSRWFGVCVGGFLWVGGFVVAVSGGVSWCVCLWLICCGVVFCFVVGFLNVVFFWGCCYVGLVFGGCWFVMVVWFRLG